MPDIYLLEPSEAEWDNENSPFYDYDIYDGFVVRAHSVYNARKICERVCKGQDDESRLVWLNPHRTTCRRLAQATGPEELILGSFKAG